MPSWLDISVDSAKAAQELSDSGRYRSSVSRAYYSAYALITGIVARKDRTYSRGWRNPSHTQMIDLLEEIGRKNNWKPSRLYACQAHLRALYNGRLDADYRPGLTVAEGQALTALGSLNFLMKKLECG